MNFPVRSGTNVSNSENKETSKWSLQLPTSNAPLWTGPRTSCPNLQELSTSLSATSLTDADLAELAAQTVRSAPTNAILAVLPALACNFWRDSSSMIDPKMLQKLPSANPRFVCGVVFKKGDIVWTCKQCAKDSTCVQCDACFSASDHEGHEVYFHRSSGRGGCCDCGDPEAWAPSGNCSKHSHAGKVSADPTSAVPAELKRGFKAVVEAVVGVIASYSTSIVRGFQNKQDNCFLSLVNENLAVRLHNDDVHTYAEVIHALTSFGLNRQRANILTTEVDQNGYALVGIASSNADSILSRATDILSSRAGLLLSITPEKIVNMEQNIVMAFSWLLSFGNTHDGLARIVAEAFSKELTLLPTCASAGKDVLAPSPVDIFPLQEQEQEQAQVSGDGDIRAKLGFPSEIQHLKRGLPSHVLADTEMTELLLHPFDRCPRNAISLLVAASPYLSPPMCKAINDLVIIYQQDAHFKVVFSQVLTILYPMLYTLYFRSIGPSKDTILASTVQVYTAASVVSMMSPDGVHERPLRERGQGSTATATANAPKAVDISNILVSTLTSIMADIGGSVRIAAGADNDNAFISHHSIRTRRYNHLCRDIEYVVESSHIAQQVLADQHGNGVLEGWLDLCSWLQCLDSMKRRADIHVERENTLWQDATNLALDLESVSTNLVSSALLPKPSRSTSKEKETIMSEGSSCNSSNSKIGNVHSDARSECARIAVDKALHALQKWQKSMPEGDLYFSTSGSAGRVKFLDHMVLFPGIRRYTVSHSPISIHTPLNRFIAKVVEFAAIADLNLRDIVLRTISVQEMEPALQALADYPLRSLVFSSQERIGMWRRNGSTAANLSANYERAPLCKILRNADLISVQVAALLLGPSSVLALTVDRFEVDEFLSLASDTVTEVSCKGGLESDKLLEYRGPMVAELLRHIIQLVTYLPCVLADHSSSSVGEGFRGNVSAEKLKSALRRDVVHMVMSDPSASISSSLQSAKYLVGGGDLVTDELLRSVVTELCERKESETTGKGTLEAKEHAYQLFDPEYVNLSSGKAHTALDRVRDFRKKKVIAAASGGGGTGGKSAAAGGNAGVTATPVLSAAAVPSPHPAFLAVRRMLYQPLMCRTIELGLLHAIKNPGALGNSMQTVVCRAVHLVTLQVLCQPSVAEYDSSEAATASPSVSSSSSTGSVQGEESVSDRWGGGLASNYFSEFFAVPDAENASVSANAPSVQMQARGAGRGMLSALASMWASGAIRDDDYYHSGLHWVLLQLSRKSPDAKGLLHEKGISFAEDESAKASAKESIAKKRLEAQRRAMSAMGKQAAAFAKHSALLDDDEDDEEDDVDGNGGDSKEARTAAAAQVARTLEDGAPAECILCREKNGTTVGYLGLIQASSVMKNAINRCLDCPEMDRVYRVVASDGCDVLASPTDGAKVIGHLARGDHVLVSTRAAKLWVRIVSPMKGWMPLYRSTPPHDLGHIGQGQSGSGSQQGQKSTERFKQQLLFSGNRLGSCYIEVCLHPVTDLQFSQLGGSKLHMSVCGHMMHMSCYEKAKKAVDPYRRSEDSHAFNPSADEMLCPLCKSLVNTIVPHTPPHIAKYHYLSTSKSNGNGFGTGSDRTIGSVGAMSVEGKESGNRHVHILADSDITPETSTGLVTVAYPNTSTTTSTTSTISTAANAANTSLSEKETVDCAQFVKSFTYYGSELLSKVSRMVPWRPQLVNTSNGNGFRARYVTLSAVAYTALSASRAKQWLQRSTGDTNISTNSNTATAATDSYSGKSISSGDAAAVLSGRDDSLLVTYADERDIVLLSQLLLLLRGQAIADSAAMSESIDSTFLYAAEHWIHATVFGNMHSAIPHVGSVPTATPLDATCRIVECRSNDIEADNDVRMALDSMPATVVGDDKYPAPGAYEALSRAHIPPNGSWPARVLPLLQQDLHTVTTASVAFSRDAESAQQLISLMCLARLAQILIEPGCTGLAANSSAAARALLEPDTAEGPRALGTSARQPPRVCVDCSTSAGTGSVTSSSVSSTTSDKLTPVHGLLLHQTTNTSGKGKDLVDAMHTEAPSVAWNSAPPAHKRDSTSDVAPRAKRQKQSDQMESGSSSSFHSDEVAANNADNIDNDISACVEALLNTQRELLTDCGVCVSPNTDTDTDANPEIGLQLIRWLVDSWIPFLEFALTLKTAYLKAIGDTSPSPLSSSSYHLPHWEGFNEGLSETDVRNIQRLTALMAALGLDTDSITNTAATATAPSSSSASSVNSLHWIRSLSLLPGSTYFLHLWAKQVGIRRAKSAATITGTDTGADADAVSSSSSHHPWIPETGASMLTSTIANTNTNASASASGSRRSNSISARNSGRLQPRLTSTGSTSSAPAPATATAPVPSVQTAVASGSTGSGSGSIVASTHVSVSVSGSTGAATPGAPTSAPTTAMDAPNNDNDDIPPLIDASSDDDEDEDDDNDDDSDLDIGDVDDLYTDDDNDDNDDDEEEEEGEEDDMNGFILNNGNGTGATGGAGDGDAFDESYEEEFEDDEEEDENELMDAETMQMFGLQPIGPVQFIGPGAGTGAGGNDDDNDDDDDNDNDEDDDMAGIAAAINGSPTDLVESIMQQLGLDPDTEPPAGIANILNSIQNQMGQLGGMAAAAANNGAGAAAGAGGARSGSGGNGGEQSVIPVKKLWRMTGVDPTYAHADSHISQFYEDQTTMFHTRSPLLGELLGIGPIFGMDASRSLCTFADVSHMGLGMRHVGGFVPLPHAYTDLHKQATFPAALCGMSVEDPAVCLLCGQVLHAGPRGPGVPKDMTPSNIGECTLHARTCGAGTGVFFLVHKCKILLMRGALSCTYPSVYLDCNGEAPEVRGQMRPMFLSQKRFRKLEELYLTHQIAREVTRQRVSAERYIRQNWY